MVQGIIKKPVSVTIPQSPQPAQQAILGSPTANPANRYFSTTLPSNELRQSFQNTQPIQISQTQFQQAQQVQQQANANFGGVRVVSQSSSVPQLQAVIPEQSQNVYNREVRTSFGITQVPAASNRIVQGRPPAPPSQFQTVKPQSVTLPTYQQNQQSSQQGSLRNTIDRNTQPPIVSYPSRPSLQIIGSTR